MYEVYVNDIEAAIEGEEPAGMMTLETDSRAEAYEQALFCVPLWDQVTITNMSPMSLDDEGNGTIVAAWLKGNQTA